MVKIKFNPPMTNYRETILIIDGDDFNCKDDSIVKITKIYKESFRISGADPDPDLSFAKWLIKSLGEGEIIYHDPPEYKEGRIY